MPACFTEEQWVPYLQASNDNPLARLMPPLMYCEDCTADYMRAMKLQARCERMDNLAVIRWVMHGKRQGMEHKE